MFNRDTSYQMTGDLHRYPTEQIHDTVVEEEIETDDSFDLDRFQVVRREFFYHLNEPSITFNQNKIGVNMACIKKLPHVEYVQFLVNQDTKKMAIRPCTESDFHSFQWSLEGTNGKRKPRAVTGKMFFMKICMMMGWNPNYRYKILGKIIKARGQYLIVFDLSAFETYRREKTNEGKVKASRTPVLPLEWQDQFGLPYGEQQRSLQVSFLDKEYAIFSLTDQEASEGRERVETL